MTIIKFYKIFYPLLIIINLLDRQDKIRIFNSAVLLIFSSFFEIFTIASLYPFLSLAFIAPNSSGNNFSDLPVWVTKLLNHNSVSLICVMYIAVVIITMILKIYIIKKTGDTIANCSNNLATKVFLGTIFSKDTENNSSEVVSNIILRCNYAMGAMINLTNILSSLIIIIGILSTLMYFSLIGTLFASTLIFSIYIFLARFTAKISIENSMTVDNLSIDLISHARQTLGNIKNIIIENRIYEETNYFRNIDSKIRKARLSNQLINNIPRIFIESMIIIIIVILSFYAFTENLNLSSLIPTIGLFIVCFQKIMPSINSIYINQANILQAHESINKLADQVVLKEFDGGITSENIDFKEMRIIGLSNSKHGSTSMLHKPITVLINAGDKCLIQGPSGIGKTTFIESLIGLNKVKTGFVYINEIGLEGRNLQKWWNSIGYVPQFSYIFNNSIYFNITLKRNDSEIDWYRFNNIISLVEMEHIVDRLKTNKISEDGGNLSGGEKQRVVLARALYSEKKFLFLDESLSGIDPKLRRRILTRIMALFSTLTIIYVSHNQEDSDLFNRHITITE